MQITLNHEEIEDAIETHVRGAISIAPNQEVTIDLKAGRGDNGFSAILDIRPSTRPSTRPPGTRAIGESVGDRQPEPEADAYIPETSGESTGEDEAAVVGEEKPATRGQPEPATQAGPRKGSIFNFADKAG